MRGQVHPNTLKPAKPQRRGRTDGEIRKARENWMTGSRFGEVKGCDGGRLDAPEVPATQLKARGTGALNCCFLCRFDVGSGVLGLFLWLPWRLWEGVRCSPPAVARPTGVFPERARVRAGPVS